MHFQVGCYLTGGLRCPRNVDTGAFMTKMYQWAATLTSNGRNMPLALPLRTDQTDNGVLVRCLKALIVFDPERPQRRHCVPSHVTICRACAEDIPCPTPAVHIIAQTCDVPARPHASCGLLMRMSVR